MGSLALALGILSATGQVQVWHVFVLAGMLGCCTVFDNPTRQAFVLEMVGPDDLRNAVSLNSVLVNAARAVGPAMAGILIATVGVSVCFLVNGVSYIAVIVSLATLNRAELRPTVPTPRKPGQLREGLRYVRSTPGLAIPLSMMALIGTLAYEFQVVLPVVARETFHGGPEVYGFMTAAMGIGAVVAGLAVAGSGRTGLRAIIIAAAGFGFAILLAASAPTLPLELVALTLVGGCSVAFIAIGNTTIQLITRPEMRGRVMSLWAVAFLGTTPLGGPVAGFVAERAGGRAGLLLGGVACLVAAAWGAAAMRRANLLAAA
jgi:MFS family permease